MWCMCCRKGASSNPAARSWPRNWSGTATAGSRAPTCRAGRRSEADMNAQPGSWEKLELERVPQLLAGHSVPWMAKARQEAFVRFSAHGLPTREEEEWRYTDVSAIGKRETLAPDN